MRIINPSFEILSPINTDNILSLLELSGRTCYKSEASITSESSKHFVKKIIDLGHESVLEHQTISVKVICDRGISHELVRHRIASYSQESTRFCKYKGGITFIKPSFYKEESANYTKWLLCMELCEKYYLELLENGSTPQEARAVLPNSLKTEIVITMNLRSWRNFFELRALGLKGKPHPQMLEIAIPMLKEFSKKIPVVFDDLLNKLKT